MLRLSSTPGCAVDPLKEGPCLSIRSYYSCFTLKKENPNDWYERNLRMYYYNPDDSWYEFFLQYFRPGWGRDKPEVNDVAELLVQYFRPDLGKLPHHIRGTVYIGVAETFKGFVVRHGNLSRYEIDEEIVPVVHELQKKVWLNKLAKVRAESLPLEVLLQHIEPFGPQHFLFCEWYHKRWFYTANIGFRIVTRASLDFLVANIDSDRVLEVGAHLGFLARCMKLLGKQWITTSKRLKDGSWTTIEKLKPAEAVAKYSDVDYLVFSSPIHGAPEALNLYITLNAQGKVIYWGEAYAMIYWGEFRNILAKKFVETSRHEPEHWEGVREEIVVYEPKANVANVIALPSPLVDIVLAFL